MGGRATQDKLVGEHVDDVGRVELAIDPDRETFPGVFVDEVEHAELPPVMGPALDEVVGPDVIGIFWSQPDAGSVIEPEPAFLGLFLGNFQPFASPDPLDPLHIHGPASFPKQHGDAPITVTSVFAGERDDIGGQGPFVSTPEQHLALRRAMLAKNPAGDAFRHAEFLLHMIDASATAGRA